MWCWHGYLSGAKCRLAYGLADATATHCLLLTLVVPEKRPLIGGGGACSEHTAYAACIASFCDVAYASRS